VEELGRHWAFAIESVSRALDAIAQAHGLPTSELADRKRRLNSERAWLTAVDWARLR
jgi:hypothetical protein